MKLLNNPKSIIGRICWNWNRRRRRIMAIERETVKTVDDYGNPNQCSYDGYFWDEELTRPLTLQDLQ